MYRQQIPQTPPPCSPSINSGITVSRSQNQETNMGTITELTQSLPVLYTLVCVCVCVCVCTYATWSHVELHGTSTTINMLHSTITRMFLWQLLCGRTHLLSTPSLTPGNHESFLHFYNYVNFFLQKWAWHLLSPHLFKNSFTRPVHIDTFLFTVITKSYPGHYGNDGQKIKIHAKKRSGKKILPLESHHPRDKSHAIWTCFSPWFWSP